MKPLMLRIVSTYGHELGLVPLPDVQVADAGEASEGEAQLPIRQLVSVLARIRTVLAGEEMRPVCDDLGLQIAVSRALLKPSDGDKVVISIQVEGRPAPLKALKPSEAENRETMELLQGLFDVDDLNGVEEVAQ